MERIKKVCIHHGLTIFYLYQDNKRHKRTKCYKCNSLSVQRRRDNIKQKAVEYLGGKCFTCDYSKSLAAMEFHHKEPDQKDFGISAKGYTRSWERVKQELDKCVLLCCRCHREIHSGERLPNW